MDGRAYTATELARVAGVTPQTASAHLRRLIEGDLLVAIPQGRHRYHRLASTEVADMLEGMLRVAARTPSCTRPRRAACRGCAKRARATGTWPVFTPWPSPITCCGPGTCCPARGIGG
ncbi:helix-turn-helix domain-containing protein [Stenotrophomonas maltophilia]|uniref:helix-turn-helix domain-containing protein n=1 Tax=Stenotrophomonas maltophilia TaxID=40324 RepID=UPI001E416A15|nr:helix-turn-helix domain-containing protein [Stenotrophomonas maltophilia]